VVVNKKKKRNVINVKEQCEKNIKSIKKYEKHPNQREKHPNQRKKQCEKIIKIRNPIQEKNRY